MGRVPAGAPVHPADGRSSALEIPTLVLPLLAPWILGTTQRAPEGERPPAGFSYVRVWADGDGASHFSDEEMTLTPIEAGPGIPPTPASMPMPAAGMRVFCPPAGGDADWHPVPGRAINVVLSGTVEIEVSDGEKRRFEAGSLILGEDTSGRGHRTRVVGSEPACFAMVLLPER